MLLYLYPIRINMANILLTNTCNQKCPYCFARNEFKKEKAEISFKDFQFVLDFLKDSNEKVIRLMGGEPTLHSQFKKVVDYVISQDLKVHIFTNGLFSNKIANFLAEKKQSIKYSFNINPENFYSKKKWDLINANLKLITPFKNSLIGSVIWQKSFNIDYLIDLANKYPIKVIILRIANPIVGAKNKYVSFNQYKILAKNIIQQIKKSNENKIRIGFGCGFSKKMFSTKQLQILKNYNIVNLNWGCDGNSGRFDIGTDLSVFRCFPLSNWQRRKLTDFRNSKEIESYLTQLMQKYQSHNSDIDFIHQGPCFSYLLSQDEEYE